MTPSAILIRHHLNNRKRALVRAVRAVSKIERQKHEDDAQKCADTIAIIEGFGECLEALEIAWDYVKSDWEGTSKFDSNENFNTIRALLAKHRPAGATTTTNAPFGMPDAGFVKGTE